MNAQTTEKHPFLEAVFLVWNNRFEDAETYFRNRSSVDALHAFYYGEVRNNFRLHLIDSAFCSICYKHYFNTNQKLNRDKIIALFDHTDLVQVATIKALLTEDKNDVKEARNRLTIAEKLLTQHHSVQFLDLLTKRTLFIPYLI
jgi:hypothetical protein